jgi:hypothetical protein
VKVSTGDGPRLPSVSPSQLRPYFSVTILECVIDDVDRAFHELVGYLRLAAHDKGRSLAVEPVGEIDFKGSDGSVDEGSTSSPTQSNLDRLYAIIRKRSTIPAWATKDSGFIDTAYQLSLAIRRGRLVAIRTEMISSLSLLKWTDRPMSPYRPLLPEVLQGAFAGDGTMVWLQGVHRQRVSIPNSKTLGGLRLQDAYDAIEDVTFALAAMRIKYVPEEANAALRGQLTVSSERSHLSAKAMHDLPMFIAAADEALAMLEKVIAAERPPSPTLPGYAVREHDITKVLGAYDIRVLSPDEVLDEASQDDLYVRRAELLRETLRDVQGETRSARLTVGIGRDGAPSTRVALRLEPTRRGFELRADESSGIPMSELSLEVLDAIQNTDLVSVYYKSGHTYANRRISRLSLASNPFSRFCFRDFTGFDVKREKPAGRGGQQLHKNIGRSGDSSLFGWVRENYREGHLICDDGAGEVADFLHLAGDNTLSVIHVKAAYSSSTSRGIAVTSFEQLVSQAEKSVRRLVPEILHADLLARQPAPRPACWTNGRRVHGRLEFLERLADRRPEDKTYVVLVQPHLTKAAWSRARSSTIAGNRTADSFRLTLLDNLLHSTRRTVTSVCDDLTVVGSY